VDGGDVGEIIEDGPEPHAFTGIDESDAHGCSRDHGSIQK
jgi:hypothetical protein